MQHPSGVSSLAPATRLGRCLAACGQHVPSVGHARPRHGHVCTATCVWYVWDCACGNHAGLIMAGFVLLQSPSDPRLMLYFGSVNHPHNDPQSIRSRQAALVSFTAGSTASGAGLLSVGLQVTGGENASVGPNVQRRQCMHTSRSGTYLVELKLSINQRRSAS